MIAALHKSPEGKVLLAVCDSDLAGRYFEEGNRQIDLRSSFYKGQERDNAAITDLFLVSHMVNLVGKKAVALGINAGIIEKCAVITIAGIPHAQMVRL